MSRKLAVRGSWFIVHSFSKKPRGFSLIELLVVISLFGFATSLITTSYISFEKRERNRAASDTLKTDFRFVQSQASSGVKVASACANSATSSSMLAAWYIKFFINGINTGNASANQYTINVLCVNKFTASTAGSGCIGNTVGPFPAYQECSSLIKTVTLADGITLHDDNQWPGTYYYHIFYQPLKSMPFFCYTSGSSQNTTFLNNSVFPVIDFSQASPNLCNPAGLLTNLPLNLSLYGPAAINILYISASGGIQ